MKLQQLIGAERQRGVRPPLVIAKFDFVYIGCKPFDDRADLATPKRLIGRVFQQSNHGKQFEFAHRAPQSNSTKQLVRRGEALRCGEKPTVNCRKTAPLKFSIGLGKLPPGRYNCQVTVLDPKSRKAAFWQAPVMVVP